MGKEEKITRKEDKKNKQFKSIDLSLWDLEEAIDIAGFRELLTARVPDSEYDVAVESIWEKTHRSCGSVDGIVEVAEVEFGYWFRPLRPEEKKKVETLKGELIKRKGTKILYGEARNKKFEHIDLSLWDLKESINVADPVGLITVGASGDRYDLATGDIWEKTRRVSNSIDEIVQVTQTVFGQQFQPLRPSEKKKIKILKEELIKRKETKIDYRDATEERFEHIDLNLWDLKKSIDAADPMELFDSGAPNYAYDIATESVWKKTHGTVTSINEIVRVVETELDRLFRPLRSEEKKKVKILKEELVKRKEIGIEYIRDIESKKFSYIDLNLRDLWESITTAVRVELFYGGSDRRYSIAVEDVWEKTRRTAVSIDEIVQITKAVLGYQFRPLRLDERKTVEVLREELIKRKETKIDWDTRDKKKFKHLALSLWDLKEAINTADPLGLLATGSHDGTYDVATEDAWEKTCRTAVSINELVQATETAFGYWFRPLRPDEKKMLKILREELIKRKKTKVYRKRMEKKFTYLGLKFWSLRSSIDAAGFVELLDSSDGDDSNGYEGAIEAIWEKTHGTATSIDEVVQTTETVFSRQFRPLRSEEKRKLEILKENLIERVESELVYEDVKDKKFKHLDLSLWDLKRSIDTADFIELLAIAPDDEYDPETRDIWEKTHGTATSINEIVQIAEVVFGHWFWPLRPEERKRLEILRKDLATRIEENKRKKMIPKKRECKREKERKQSHGVKMRGIWRKFFEADE